MANYSCKKFPYYLPVSLGTLVTDRRTDGQTDRLTDDNRANSSTVTKVWSSNLIW